MKTGYRSNCVRGKSLSTNYDRNVQSSIMYICSRRSSFADCTALPHLYQIVRRVFNDITISPNHDSNSSMDNPTLMLSAGKQASRAFTG